MTPQSAHHILEKLKQRPKVSSVLEIFWITVAGALAVIAGLVGIASLATRFTVEPELIAKERSLRPQEISTVEDYEKHCQSQDERQREACRKSLHVYQYSLVWIDSRALLQESEELSPKHLDILHGFSEQEAEAGRLAVGSLLASWCRQHGVSAPRDFEDLKKRGCTKNLPTLAEMGLELDPTWNDVRSIESDYDGRSKVVFAPRETEEERR